MCGIVGYAGERPCRELLLDALERLEYRGYDSAGLSLQSDTGLERIRTVGNLERLRAAVEEHDLELSAGRPGAGSRRSTSPTRRPWRPSASATLAGPRTAP